MEKLNIAPNPAREWFTVGFEQAWQQAGILRVYDMLGRMQYEVVMPSGTKQTKVRCEGWKTGLYLVRWQSSGKVVSGKVVIK
jgi:hypothetical protein